MDKDTIIPSTQSTSDATSLAGSTFTEDSKKALAILLLLKEYISSVAYDIQLCSFLLKSLHSHVLGHPLEYPKHTLNLYHDLCLKWSDFGNRLLGLLFSRLGGGNRQSIIALITAFTAQVQSIDTKLVIDLLSQHKDTIDAVEYVAHFRRSREKSLTGISTTGGAFPLLSNLQEPAHPSTSIDHVVDKSVSPHNQ